MDPRRWPLGLFHALRFAGTVCLAGMIGCAGWAPSLEESGEVEKSSGFISPLFGWGESPSSRFHYLLPFYYYATQKEEASLTLLFPLLTAHYSGSVKGSVHMKGAASLPLLAVMGSARWSDREASGFYAPYLAVGTLSRDRPDFEMEASGAVILPWLPLLDDFLSVDFCTNAGAGNMRGRYAAWNAFAIPGLDFHLLERRSAGIEEDFRFFNFWDISLYRSYLDLPGVGFAPHRRELDATRVKHEVFFAGEDNRSPSLSQEFMDRLDEARSGNPVNHAGFLDPMMVYEEQGEDLKALGWEPWFYYDREEGLSLPWLLLNFGDEGASFGLPAVRHLFPLFHGNAEGTRYQFLLNYGTCYTFKDYTAVDLKLLFNYQRHANRGTAWGFLPFFFGGFPGRALSGDVRFVQLPGHVLSYWNVDGDQGFEVLPPFLFSGSWRASERTDDSESAFSLGPFGLLFDYEREFEGDVEHSSLWTLLHSYESEMRGSGVEARRRKKLWLGPFGLLFRYEQDTGVYVKGRFLLIFGYDASEEGVTLDFLGIPVYRDA